MKSISQAMLVAITLISGLPSFTVAQTQTDASTATHVPVTIDNSTDYPGDRPGVMIQNGDWVPINAVMPAKSRIKNRVASSLSYGAAPATVVAQYEGLHASVQVAPGQPVICICHFLSLPGEPVLVRLHPKKNSRELDGGKMHVLPVVGASKMVDAQQTDLIPTDVSQPENMVWLVRPQQPLPAGEYALMLGTQNVSIFPFTVAASTDSAPPAPKQ